MYAYVYMYVHVYMYIYSDIGYMSMGDVIIVYRVGYLLGFAPTPAPVRTATTR